MKIDYIVLHHTATSGLGDGEIEWNAIINACQQRRGSNYICDYHYGIGPTGKLFMGMPIANPCWHCGNDDINRRSLAVACIGNFEEQPMPIPQKDRLIQCIKDLKSQYPEAKIKLHKEIVPTLCPGKYYPTADILSIQNTTATFTDLSPTHYFYPAIMEIVKKGIMRSDTEGTFRPNDPVTRAELAQVLLNLLYFTRKETNE